MPSGDKLKLTKRSIDAIPSPTGAERVVIHDTEVKGFSIRISRGARTFYLYRWASGRPQRFRLGTYPELAPEAARRLAEKMNGEVAQGADIAAERRKSRQPNRTDPTLGEVFDHTLENHWKPRARTWKEQQRIFDTYTPAAWKNRPVSTLSKLEVLEVHTRLGKKNGSFTANRWRGVLHRLFEVASDDFDFAGGNPVRRVRAFAEEERERFLSPEELPRLFDAIDAAEDVRIADYLRLALLTGARKTALLRMRFADADLTRAVWTIPPTDSKNGKPIHVPLVAEAVEVIRSRLFAASGREYVFPGRHGIGHLTDPTRPLAKVFKAAGFTDVRLHDLRRTFGSWQAANGSSELLIGKSLGHRHSRSTQVYARLTLDPVRESVERATSAMTEVVKADRRRRKKAEERSGER
jgi:integrase